MVSPRTSLTGFGHLAWRTYRFGNTSIGKASLRYSRSGQYGLGASAWDTVSPAGTTRQWVRGIDQLDLVLHCASVLVVARP